MQYFYLTFTCAHGGRGNTVLKQHPGPNGFNFANAHAYLQTMLKCPAIVDTYYEINEQRYTEFKAWADKMAAAQKIPAKPMAPIFQLHQGGKEEQPKTP
jgi:hypothetical protein